MANILNLQLLNGNVIKYQDKSELKIKLFPDVKRDLSGLPAEFILKRNNEVYLRKETIVGKDNTVVVVIGKMPRPRTYIVEVVVNGKYFFPSDNKVELTIERSSIEATEVAPQEREQVSDLIKKELSGLDLSGAGTGSGGNRTDIAYCKAIGKPLGEVIPYNVVSGNRIEYQVELNKDYHFNFEKGKTRDDYYKFYGTDYIFNSISYIGVDTKSNTDYMYDRDYAILYNPDNKRLTINHKTGEKKRKSIFLFGCQCGYYQSTYFVKTHRPRRAHPVQRLYHHQSL